MAEGGEGATVALKIADRQRLQGIAQNVVLEGRRRGAPPLNAVDQRRYEGADRLARVGKWQEGLDELRGDGREIAGNLRAVVDKFGIRRNAAGAKDRTPEEDRRYTRANRALNGLTAILETEGFDQMPNAQQNRLRGLVRTALERNARIPDFARMRPPQQNEVIDRFLRDPKLKQELFDVLTDIQGMPLTAETETIGAAKQVALSRVSYDTADRKARYSLEDLDEATDRLARIRANPATANLGVQAQMLMDQIVGLTNQMGNLQRIEGNFRRTLAAAPREIPVDQINPRTGAVTRVMVRNPEIQQTIAALEANAQQQAKLQEDIARTNIERIGRVPSEEGLEDRRLAKTDELGKNRGDQVEAQFDERGNRVARQELVDERGLQEENITRRLEEAIQRSLARYVNSELRQSMEHFEANEGEVQSETMKAVRTALARHFEARWTIPAQRNRGIFRRRQNEPAINAAAVNRDFDRLMQGGNNGGVEPLMRDVLRRIRPVGPGNVRAALPAAEINTLMNDDTFAEEMRGELLKNVIARRGIVRPFRPGELYQMTNMPPVREAITGAMETNSSFRTFVRETVGDEDAEENPQEFWNRFSREAWEQPGLLLFPVTTIPWSIWAGIRAAWRGRQNERAREALALAA